MPKMKIFNSLEKEAFDSPPEFNSVERKQFFSLSLLLKNSVADLRTPTNQVCFLAVAGYFKARRKFFALEIATLVRVQYRHKLVLMEALQILKRQKI